MKILNYHVQMNSDNSGTLIVDTGTEEKIVSTLYNIGHLSASEVDERAKLELKSYDYEIASDISEIFTPEPYMGDQQTDLAIVRTAMRKILRELGKKDVPLSTKKESLPVYSQICQASQVITNACKIELQIEALKKIK